MNWEKQEKIRLFCEKYQMFEKGDGIVIGLSGGADSVFLLHFLKNIQKQYTLRLYAVHIHHGIRGVEADRDQEFARQCAQSLDIPFECVHYNIPFLAKQEGMSEEEAGRHYRYECFREFAKRQGCRRIAVAHHKDDQAETVLFQLLRGSGLRGLGGIRPQQDDIIRPLLTVSRQEIEEELRAEGIDWREDSTNQERDYARNKLRLEVIPYLQREIQPETVGHMAETALQMQAVWEYIDKQVKTAREKIAYFESGKICFDRSAFLEIDSTLQSYILLELMEEMAGSRKDLSSVHVSAWMELIRGETGKRISLPYQMQAGRDYDVIWLAKSEESERGKKTEECQVSRLTDGKTGGQDIMPGTVEMQQISREKLSGVIPKNHCTKWFDYAKIIDGFVWRHPMSGDHMVIDRQGHTKKLSRILIENKIPREKRNALWVLADGERILWVPQIRRTNMGYYVTGETKEVLVVHIDGERWNTL